MSVAYSVFRRRAAFPRMRDSGAVGFKPAFVMQYAVGEADALRVGFTATKKIGVATRRNRAKRRLRSLAAKGLRLWATQGRDYVFIARAGVLTRDFYDMADDLFFALKKAGCLRPDASRAAFKEAAS